MQGLTGAWLAILDTINVNERLEELVKKPNGSRSTFRSAPNEILQAWQNGGHERFMAVQQNGRHERFMAGQQNGRHERFMAAQQNGRH